MAYNPRQAPVVAPDKGSFPLDHEGACKPRAKELMACLKENAGQAMACRKLSQAYLECRMEHGLMTKEPLKTLGFDGSEDELQRRATQPSSEGDAGTRAKEKKGFVSGLEVKPLPKDQK